MGELELFPGEIDWIPGAVYLDDDEEDCQLKIVKVKRIKARRSALTGKFILKKKPS